MTVASLLQEIDSVYQSCHEEDWDGYGAKPITKESTDGIRALINGLPERFLRGAEIGCDPDGCMNIEWNFKGKKLSVNTLSVSANGKDSFDLAAVFPRGNCHGKFPRMRLIGILWHLLDWVKE